MRSILQMQDNKGQMMIVQLMFIVMAIAVLTALVPVLRTMLDTARHQDGLNCQSNINDCSSNTEKPCYNSSKDKSTTACLVLDLYLVYIILIVLVGGITALLYKRTFGGPYEQPGY